MSELGSVKHRWNCTSDPRVHVHVPCSSATTSLRVVVVMVVLVIVVATGARCTTAALSSVDVHRQPVVVAVAVMARRRTSSARCCRCLWFVGRISVWNGGLYIDRSCVGTSLHAHPPVACPDAQRRGDEDDAESRKERVELHIPIHHVQDKTPDEQPRCHERQHTHYLATSV